MLRLGPPAPAPHSRYADTELPVSVARLIGRYYFGTAALATSAAALMVLALGRATPTGWRAALLAAMATYALACAWAALADLHERRAIVAAQLMAGLGAIALITAAAFAFGDGLRSPALAYFALVVCLVGAVSRLRWGLAMAAVGLSQVLLLGWAEHAGWTAAPTAGLPLPLALWFHALLIASGVAGGTLLSRMLDHYLRAATQRERRFRTLLRIAADWYWEQDKQFRYTHVSDNPRSGLDTPREALIGRTPWEARALDMSEETLAAHRADLEAHRPFSGRLARQRDAKGRQRYVALSGEPKFDADGRFEGYWGVGRDITAEVRAQRAMAASEARYRQLFQCSPSPLLLHRNGIVFDANEAAASMFGFGGVAEMTGYDLREAYRDPAELERVCQRIAQIEAMPSGQGLPVGEFRMVSRSGRRLSVQATAARVDMPDGPATLSLYYDITARVEAETAQQRSQALLSHLVDTSPSLIALTEMASGRFAMVNPGFSRMLGYSSDEVVGRSALELGIWHRDEEREHLVATLLAHDVAHELQVTFVAKSGALVNMQLSAARFEMDGMDYLVVNAYDVTETERTRREHEAILLNASIGIAFTRERLFQQVNPSFERMFGWPPRTLAGQGTGVVWPSAAEYEALREAATPLLSQGLAYENEHQLKRADGNLFWCRMRGQALDPASLSRGGTIWIAEDVTERRQYDQALAAARDAAEAANRAKSAFLANTSHEIRTPLNGLLGLARLAMQGELDEARRRQYLEQIYDSAHSLAGIISDILDLSKIEAGKIALEAVPLRLREMLAAVHDAYLSLAQAKGLELTLAIDDCVSATVLGDPVRVRQILSNFVSNAIKFTERGGVRIHAGAGMAAGLRFAVSDSGPGVDEATQRRLFMPFTQADDSTTRRYGGTGLGLSICRELAHLMGGEVGMDSLPGVGSTFWAELPLPPVSATDAAHEAGGATAQPLAGARVLLVEDNPVNMLIAVAMLEQWGVEVAQAGDGADAIAAVERSAQQGRLYDAVLMDLQMPQMSGHEAASVLRRRYDAAELPIIALTAAALVSERESALASGMNEFLTKPIDAQRLHETLARTIAQRVN